MSKFNMLVFLNAYGDNNSSNAPSQNNFKWNRDINGLLVGNPQSLSFSLAPGETKTLFNGTRSLSQDGTTQYSIALKPFTSNTYILSAVAGTLPNFRAPRVPGADATTQITVGLNGPLMTLTSTGGTPLDLVSGGVVVGDYVRLGNLFNPLNVGVYKILALTATSLTVEHDLPSAEGPITLGAGYASQLSMYGAAGVQANDTILISGGFSLVTQGAYKVTGVSDNFLEFYSTDILPVEGPITTQALALYSAAKRLVYLESNQNVSLMLNGSASGNVEPLVANNYIQPGVFMRTATLYSMSVTNDSTDTASLFLASVE